MAWRRGDLSGEEMLAARCRSGEENVCTVIWGVVGSAKMGGGVGCCG